MKEKVTIENGFEPVNLDGSFLPVVMVWVDQTGQLKTQTILLTEETTVSALEMFAEWKPTFADCPP